jgi:hypothetical protein
MADINKTNPMPTLCCPFCGKRYAPSEIFIPKEFFGTASMVDNEHYFGREMDLTERYSCDRCGNTFGVVAEISFTCSRMIYDNFDENF